MAAAVPMARGSVFKSAAVRYFIDKPMRLLHQRDQTDMLLLDLVRREPTGVSSAH